jgi:hypothetical protein
MIDINRRVNRRVDRRLAISLALAALPAVWLLRSSPARAQQAFRKFFPFLIDLDGWQGHTPDGMSMEMGNTSMLTAAREYHRGAAHIGVGVVIGPAAAGALAAGLNGMNIDTTEGHVITSTMDSFTVVRTFTIKEKSGVVLVRLGPSATFNFTYSGLTEDEAMPLAKKFDWKAIQTAALQA